LNFDDSSAYGPAQRAFVRVLRMALPEDERLRRALRDALDSAGLTDLPSEPGELLRLAEEHLVPRLEGEIVPNLLLAMTEDLAVEMDQPAGKGPSKRSRMAAPTVRAPARPRPTERPPPHPRDHGAALENFLTDRVKTPFPKPKRSVAKLGRTTSAKLRKALKDPVDPALTLFGERPTVFVVESDPVVRASIARSLVSAQCDVRVMDSISDLLLVVEGGGRAAIAIAIVTVDGLGVGATLQALVGAKISLWILARTEAPSMAEGILTAAGVRNFGTVSKAASGLQLLEAVRLVARGPRAG
jgi:hypothetical protein